MNDLYVEWGQRVKAARTALAMTQRGLSHLTGFSQQFIASVEQGKRGIGDDSRIRIAAALGADVNELFAYPEVAA